MHRRALLTSLVTVPLAGCTSVLGGSDATRVDTPTETPVRAVPASFETLGGYVGPNDEPRATAHAGERRVVVTGRAHLDGCHEFHLGDVTLVDRTVVVVVDQSPLFDDLDEYDCGAADIDYRVALQVDPDRVDTVAVDHRHPEFGTTFETTVDPSVATTIEGHGSPVVSTTAEES
ncbi:hypothetical protein [Halomarina rubra]|uniref:Lipoprotein n=1 Tax=Halomarina rubra TaxID=2071873 RepID=A0ABD6AUF7_9EURY|nr:hypothetical protein [Halomarina rubra]